MISGTEVSISRIYTTSCYSVQLDTRRSGIIDLTTTVTNDAGEVESWIDRNCAMSGTEVLGLEVIGCSSTSSKPAILTLCSSRHRCLIVQLCHLSKIPGKLQHLLLSENQFVGANVAHSAAMLKDGYGIDFSKHSNLSDLAKGRSLLMKSVDPAADLTFVSILMTNLHIMRKNPEVYGAVWEKEKLEDDQVVYAELDVYVSYIIGRPDDHQNRQGRRTTPTRLIRSPAPTRFRSQSRSRAQSRSETYRQGQRTAPKRLIGSPTPSWSRSVSLSPSLSS